MTTRAPRIPIELPDSIAIECEFDGRDGQGMLVLLTLNVDAKNEYNVVVGPSSSNGLILVARQQILDEVIRTTETFPADYAGLTAFDGTIIVAPMDLAGIEAAFKAYDLYHAAIPFPWGYADRLKLARSVLLHQSPRRLSVSATASYPASATPAAGVKLVTVDKANAGSMSVPAHQP